MCGITGYWQKEKIHDEKQLLEMSQPIFNRGPDDYGFYIDKNCGLGLAHRRLSILDLSKFGHQPMTSFSGRYQIIYNGEIYNHREIRENLKSNNINWLGNSDTETLVNCIEIIGFKKTLEMLRGMFSIALWDKKTEELWLARDRFGEKPLFYGIQNNVFLFGSQISSIRKHKAFNNKINKNAVDDFFKNSFIGIGHSIYSGILKLTPGTYIKISNDNLINQTLPRPKVYWSLEDAYSDLHRPLNENYEISKKNLTELIDRSVSSMMISDVPIGAFLSGGIDSSLIAYFMQKNSNQKIKTFTIGFEQDKYDEAKYAKKVANIIGTDHKELYLNNKDLINTVPLMADIYDEPFADSSQIPTYLLSKMVKEDVSVALSGDGGDEIFGGYNRHIFASKYSRYIKNISPKLRKSVIYLLNRIPLHFLERIELKRLNQLNDKVQKIISAISSTDEIDLYARLISTSSVELLLENSIEKDFGINKSIFHNNLYNLEEKFMIHDSISYLPDDILVKVDRASMYNSLETRAPFLDHKIFEYAASIPTEHKIKNDSGKIILKDILYDFLPENLFNRPKSGFTPPISEWIKGPLKEFANDLLSEGQINKHNLLDVSSVQRVLNDHINGKANNGESIWKLLMFQSWSDKNL